MSSILFRFSQICIILTLFAITAITKCLQLLTASIQLNNTIVVFLQKFVPPGTASFSQWSSNYAKHMNKWHPAPVSLTWPIQVNIVFTLHEINQEIIVRIGSLYNVTDVPLIVIRTSYILPWLVRIITVSYNF